MASQKDPIDHYKALKIGYKLLRSRGSFKPKARGFAYRGKENRISCFLACHIGKGVSTGAFDALFVQCSIRRIERRDASGWGVPFVARRGVPEVFRWSGMVIL